MVNFRFFLLRHLISVKVTFVYYKIFVLKKAEIFIRKMCFLSWLLTSKCLFLQALPVLKTSNLLPYVIFITVPRIDQLNRLREYDENGEPFNPNVRLKVSLSWFWVMVKLKLETSLNKNSRVSHWDLLSLLLIRKSQTDFILLLLPLEFKNISHFAPLDLFYKRPFNWKCLVTLQFSRTNISHFALLDFFYKRLFNWKCLVQISRINLTGIFLFIHFAFYFP